MLAAVPQWDGWREINEEDHYYLMFRHNKESTAGIFSEAKGLYYNIGMDPNVGQLWKQTLSHVDATVAGDPMASLTTELEPLLSTINIATGEGAETTEVGGAPPSEKKG
ncbi:hypothetical protein E4T56_gene11261 [Termitomyces sp. T112]|nr:hypothetical protein C0989_005222 [Termitomyces sp. Mn162]KAG5723972.1 hypothetical protein E4T56_gene11261 [Termitomyces sp. T112]KNZ78032.1 hypothetical protein J132_02676 [Termitomyces sp. J132]